MGETITCKECRYFNEHHFPNGESYGWFCDRTHIESEPNESCSRGVRKHDNDLNRKE